VQIRGVQEGWRYDFPEGFVLPWGDGRILGGMYELVPRSGCDESEIGSFARSLRVTNRQLDELGKRGALTGRAEQAFCRWNGFTNRESQSTRVDKQRKVPTETMESLWG